VGTAADAVHAELLGRYMASVVNFGLRPHGDVDEVPSCVDGWIGVRGNGIDFIVDDDEDFERVELGERRHDWKGLGG
jgi:hypothetical protein